MRVVSSLLGATEISDYNIALGGLVGKKRSDGETRGALFVLLSTWTLCLVPQDQTQAALDASFSMNDATPRHSTDVRQNDNNENNHSITNNHCITNDDKVSITTGAKHRDTNGAKRESSDTSEVKHCSTNGVDHCSTNGVKHRAINGVKHYDTDDVNHRDADDLKRRGTDDVKQRDVDSGWAWVVLVASFINLSLLACASVSVGLFLVEFLDTFSGSKGFIALIGAMAVSGQSLLGPVAGILSNFLSARLTIIIGGALYSLGMVFSSFSDDLVTLLLFYGLLAGVGGGLSYTPAVTSVSAYFHKYRVIANGVSLSAPGLGLVLGSYLQRWLIEDHGWRYAMVITGCIMAQTCVLASLLYPHDPSMTPSCCSPCRKTNSPDSPTAEAQEPLQPAEDRGLTRLRKEFSSTATIKDMVGSKTAIHMSEFGSVLLSNSVVWTVEEVTSPSMRIRVKRLLSNKFMWVMCLNQFLFMAGFSINSILFPSYAQSVGVAFHDLPSLYLVYGVTLTVSRVTGGVIFSRVPNQLVKIFFGCQIFVSLLLALLPFYGASLPAFYAYKFILAVTYGSTFLLVTPILLHYVGLDDLSVAFGCIMLCCGLGLLSAPPLGGMMYDMFGSYTMTYHLAGCTTGLAAMSLLLMLLIKDLNPSRDLDVKEETLLGGRKGSDSPPSSTHDVEMANGKRSLNVHEKSQVHMINDVEEFHDLVRDCHS